MCNVYSVCVCENHFYEVGLTDKGLIAPWAPAASTEEVLTQMHRNPLLLNLDNFTAIPVITQIQLKAVCKRARSIGF